MTIGIKRILVPTDFSPCAMSAARYARALAEKFGAVVHFLHVAEPSVPPSDPLAYAISSGADGALDSLAARAKPLMAEFAGVFAPSGIPCETEVLVGDSVRITADRAAATGASLVVVGTHGRRGFQRFLMGSTAEGLLRHAPCPVIVVREHDRLPEPGDKPLPVLAPTDASPASERAADWAGLLAERFGARLELLYVADREPSALDNEQTRGDMGELAAPVTLREYRRTQLEQFAAARLPTGAERTLHIDAGRPAERIVARAEAVGAGLICIGTHRRGAIMRMLLGSTAVEIVRSANCPVLVTA